MALYLQGHDQADKRQIGTEMLGRLQQWRHKRGFGVHSPFAYDFITTTLRERRGYAYYAYPQISRANRRLYRVLVRLCPALVRSVRSDADLMAAVGRLNAAATAGDACPGDRHIVLLPPYTADKEELWQQTLSRARSGMSFASGSLRVFVASPTLPRQDFKL